MFADLDELPPLRKPFFKPLLGFKLAPGFGAVTASRVGAEATLLPLLGAVLAAAAVIAGEGLEAFLEGKFGIAAESGPSSGGTSPSSSLSVSMARVVVWLLAPRVLCVRFAVAPLWVRVTNSLLGPGANRCGAQGLTM